MKLRSMKVQEEPKLMIIPMIDIIFFLLVFFMISTMTMVQQNTFKVGLPQASSAQLDMNQHANITVMADGNIAFNKESLDKEQLIRRVQIELQRNPDLQVILNGDKDVNYGFVIETFDALKQAGVKKLSIAVEKR
ncbi:MULTISPECIES: biopolymer transporter ExbD [unclassified Veillonella]|uniref:ExbD/TolR family protein n=1 Tax=unclassified Veillonella TaxID=2630086 RepID=UPI000F8DC4D6|nr:MULTISPECIES: biopolymer transporter ExbD [unclassified Veillonella]